VTRSQSVLDEIGRLAADGRWDEIAAEIQRDPSLVKAQDEFGSTALHRVAPFGGAAQTVRLMIAKGADVNKIDKTGVSPLGVAISGGHRYGLTTDENVEVILDAGADLRLEAQNGHPALHWAILERKPSIVRLLLEAGADPRATNSYGEDAYEIAARTKSKDIQDLLAKNA
jgi:ankyrin repeat protein